MSFGDSELDLDSGGYILLNGKNNSSSDTALSNGSGKSSLIEAIAWALTGETIRGTKDVVNIYGNDGTYVDLTFTVNKDSYHIIRSREHKEYKTNLLIYINGENKSGKGIRDSEALLKQYLPDITLSLIGSVIILGQGLPQRFTSNSPVGRKEVLEKLCKADFMIEDLKARLANRQSILNATKRTYEDEALKLVTTKALKQKQLADSKSSLDGLGDLNDTETQINTLTDNYTKIQEELAKHEQWATTATQKQDEAQNLITNLLTAKNDAKQVIVESYRGRLQEVTDKRNAISGNIIALKNEISQLDRVIDICPTCKQKLPNVTKIDTTDKKKQLAELLSTQTKYSSEYQQIELECINKQTEKENEFKTDYDCYVKRVNECKDYINKITPTIVSERNSLLNIQQQINKLTVIKEKYELTKQTLLNTITNIETELLEIDEKILYNNNEAEVIKAHLETLSRMNNYLTRDFRGVLLEDIIAYIDYKAKEYAKEVFETDKISFVLEGNSINISYNGKSYEGLSGGEKQKVDLIIQFSIRDLLCKYMNFSSNILVLDEIADNVDTVGAEHLFKVIASKLIDLETIYIVSHHTDFPIPVDKIITVVKSENGISEIKYDV